MTTPPPPWEAHPPLPEDEFAFADAEPRPERDVDPDEDTGPVQVVTQPDADVGVGYAQPVDERPRPSYGPTAWRDDYRPLPRPEDTFAARFTAPLTVDPRTVPVRPNGIRPGLIAAAVAGVALVALAVWFLWPAGDTDSVNATAAAPTSTVDADGLERLKAVLPPGYSSDACRPVEATKDAVAMVDCTQNADVGGPATATYTLMKDGDALSAAMDNAVADAKIVNCPGNIQSPGPWRRNATPTKVAGTLVCGLPQGKPLVAWTNDAELLLSVVRAGPEGPTLDQLYKWWSNHS
jgi:hypothetical protein